MALTLRDSLETTNKLLYNYDTEYITVKTHTGETIKIVDNSLDLPICLAECEPYKIDEKMEMREKGAMLIRDMTNANGTYLACE